MTKIILQGQKTHYAQYANSGFLNAKNICVHKKEIYELLRYNTWVTNKKQEKVLLWYNLIGQTTIERRTNSCARIIPQKLTIVNVCLSME